jgi:hypothetical protein
VVDRAAIERTPEHVRQILEAAERSADEIRAAATREAGARVERVEHAAAGLLESIEALERELTAIREAVRASAERLTRGLEGLRDEARGDDGAARTGAPVAAGDEAATTAAGGPSPGTENGDEAGARLAALNLVLEGRPREEAARYLAEHFAVADPEALLDDVYARAAK